MDEHRIPRYGWRIKWMGVQGLPRLGLMDGVNVALGSRGMTVEATRQCANDRKSPSAYV